MQQVDLEIQWLRTFEIVVRTGSMTAAAELLCHSQSAVSMHIRKLEEVLDVRLFNRKNRAITLTSAGHELLDYAEQMLALHSRAKSAIKGSALCGKVCLGIPDDYANAYLPNILKCFSEQYPAVELNIICEPSSQLLPAIEGGKIDIAVVTRDTPGRGQLLFSEPLVWVGYIPEFILSSDPIPIAMYEFGSEARKKIISKLDHIKSGYRIVYNSPYIAGQIAVARSGVALSVLTRCSVPQDMKILSHPELPDLPVLDVVIVKGSHFPDEHPASLLYAKIIDLFKKNN